LAGALTLSLGAARASDDESSLGKRLRLEVGLGLPTAESGKDFVGKSPMTGGLSYDLGRTGQGTWGLYTSSILRSRDVPTSTPGKTTQSTGMIGFGLQYRQRAGSLYLGGGVGTYSVMDSTLRRDGDTTSTTTTEKSVVGGRVFVGKDINQRVFVEGSYTKVGGTRLGSAPSRDLSHASLNIGYRF
jgi:hypothetical protein